MKEFELKYGINPNQKPARIYSKTEELPFEILSGRPGYINFLDALNSWQLVKDLKSAFGVPAATSFKHVSPAGAALAKPLTDIEKQVFRAEKIDISPVCSAYIRARGADRMSSFGDFLAVSDNVDITLAKYINREVSDGVIAPSYDEDALQLLREKKNGVYCVIKIDPDFEPEDTEERSVFGVTFNQGRNKLKISPEDLSNVVTKRRQIPDEAIKDLILALITLKYTQSNSVCFTKDGQVIGNGAGQQSRIHCTRLAGSKADIWQLRHHPAVLSLPFKKNIKRSDKDNAVDQYLRDDVTENEMNAWKDLFTVIPKKLAQDEKNEWLAKNKRVSLGSDAFFPFRDNIDRAYASGVEYIAQPGGSISDDEIIKTCDDYNIAMAFTEIRLFHH